MYASHLVVINYNLMLAIRQGPYMTHQPSANPGFIKQPTSPYKANHKMDVFSKNNRLYLAFFRGIVSQPH